MNSDNNSAILSSEIDKSQIPPIHQKRILAFLNHFIISTSTFLNDFAGVVEHKFIEVERKMQKVESSLIILEAKLSSIPGLEQNIEPNETTITKGNEEKLVNDFVDNKEVQPNTNNNEELQPTPTAIESTAEDVVISGVRASEDSRYIKFFKMVQVGVPLGAVKIKMGVEGLDAQILDNPNLILADGVRADIQ